MSDPTHDKPEHHQDSVSDPTHDKPRHRKGVEIIVNSRERYVEDRHVTFQEVIALAYDDPPSGEYIEFTVTYRNGPSGRKGFLVRGRSIPIADGMIFDVKFTDKS